MTAVVGKPEYDAKSRGRSEKIKSKIIKKKFNIPVFRHHINVRKREKIIPHLCECKKINSTFM